MKIALFSVSGRLSSDGSRLISALLKQAGHSVKSVFLARPEPLEYEPEELNQLDGILSESDLVMIAVYSSYAIRAVQITKYVHLNYQGIKVIWGGPHCISAPELGLRYADGVCFSEGDEVIVDFVNQMEAGKEYLTTPNMAFNVDGSNVINRVLPPFSNLDSLPHYDFTLEDHFLLDRRLVPMTKERLRERLAGYPYYIPILYYQTSRGCPHKCAYCNNCRYISMFGHNTMRFYSVDRVIEELEHTLKDLDFVQFLGFGDDDFFMRSTEQIEEFAKKYKEKIGLPFGVAVSVNTYRKEKMEMLLDYGLKAIQMGVQSGSQRILDEVYNRKIEITKSKDVVHQIEKYQEIYGLDFFLDFIIDNPYETKYDIMQTFKYILDLGQRVKVNIFLLAFFPGTPIYERVLRDGIIDPFDETVFSFFTRSRIRYQKNYETFLVLLLRHLRRYSRLWRYIPKFVLRIMGSRFMRLVATIFPRPLYAFMSKIVQ